ncbi:hypothetical protein DFH09DRAFT_1305143 [Mycena vulgaris]|nr:hypothetical protein DFH09DRAFT_1305143 [Mycena vulgaris]
MSLLPPIHTALIELFFAFSLSSLAIIVLLHLVAVPFPLFAVLRITSFWTLIVLATMRAVGAIWICVNNARTEDKASKKEPYSSSEDSDIDGDVKAGEMV